MIFTGTLGYHTPANISNDLCLQLCQCWMKQMQNNQNQGKQSFFTLKINANFFNDSCDKLNQLIGQTKLQINEMEITVYKAKYMKNIEQLVLNSRVEYLKIDWCRNTLKHIVEIFTYWKNYVQLKSLKMIKLNTCFIPLSKHSV